MRLIFLCFFLFKTEFVKVEYPVGNNTDRCVALLRKVMKEQPEWIKVHAAEYLLWTGYNEGVKEVFLKEDKLYGSQSPYRIGIWRVLTQAAGSEQEKGIWINKIKQAYLDSNGTDRVHAAETLAKLRLSPFYDNQDLTNRVLKDPVKALAIYTLWSVAFTSDLYLKDSKAKLLALAFGQTERENSTQSLAAYAIRHLKNISKLDWQKLVKAAWDEPENSNAKVNLLSAAWVTYTKGKIADQEQLSLVHTQLLKYKNAKNKGARTEMAMALAEKGTNEDLPVLIALLDNQDRLGNVADDLDVRAAAAYAILKIEKR